MPSVAQKLSQVPPTWMNIIVCAVGIICVLCGVVLPDKDYPMWKNFLLGVGSSVVASAVVAYLTSHYMTAQNEVLTLIDDWRLHGIYRTRAESNEVINPCLEGATHLEIIALGLRGFRDRNSSLIESRVKAGLAIRILTLAPESGFVSARTKAEDHQGGQLKKEITDLLKWCQHLRSIAPKAINVQVRTYDAPNLDFYFRLDDLVFVGPYLQGKTSQQTITYAFSAGGKGFAYWRDYFEELWNEANFCQDAQTKDAS